MQRGVALVFVLTACASTPSVVYKGITDQSMLIEQRPLPDRPDKEQLTDAQNQTYPVAKGSIAPADGVLVGPEKAARILKIKTGYDELRGMYEADRQIFKDNRIIYEERLQQANAEIGRLSPGWWSENKGTLAFIVGMVLGSVLATATCVVAVQIH